MKPTNMKLRDSIALEVLKTFILKNEPKDLPPGEFEEFVLRYSRGAYGYADAMLIAREEEYL